MIYIPRYSYRLSNSKKLDRCEVCNKSVGEIYILTQHRTFLRPNGSEGCMYNSFFPAKFGHKSCLSKFTEETIGMKVGYKKNTENNETKVILHENDVVSKLTQYGWVKEEEFKHLFTASLKVKTINVFDKVELRPMTSDCSTFYFRVVLISKGENALRFCTLEFHQDNKYNFDQMIKRFHDNVINTLKSVFSIKFCPGGVEYLNKYQD